MGLWRDMEEMEMTCCGTVMALPAFRVQYLREHKIGFWCGSCGSARIFTGESLESKVKRLEHERDAARSRLHESLKMRDHIEKQNTKLKKRIANGVCPCCKRSFSNVQRHMKSKHPDFQESKS